MIHKFIAFEGCDFTGKSTQLQKLADYLEKAGKPHIITSDLYKTDIGKLAKDFLKNKSKTAKEKVEKVIDARKVNYESLIEPALRNHKIVLCDRYTTSTLVFQGKLADYDIDKIKNEQERRKIQEPNIVLVFDTTAEIILKRREGREENDNLDPQNKDDIEKILTAYRELVKTEPNHYLINANKKPEEVFEAVLKVLKLI